MRLTTVLWRERRLLEVLLFKLVEEEMVVALGEQRWVARATRELEIVLDQVKVSELGREVEFGALAGALGFGAATDSVPGADPDSAAGGQMTTGAFGGVTLRALIASAEAPWHDILAEHREAFLSLTGEITEVASRNRVLIARARDATRVTLRWLEGDPAGIVDPHLGRAPRTGGAPHLGGTVL